MAIDNEKTELGPYLCLKALVSCSPPDGKKKESNVPIPKATKKKAKTTTAAQDKTFLRCGVLRLLKQLLLNLIPPLPSQ